ncbi:MAG: chemotaxis protein CheA, partial [Stellaceae bacterium]
RNAVDHGIESPAERAAAEKPVEGALTIRAEQRGGEVRLKVIDDGRGLNEKAILAKAIARGLVSSVDAARLKPVEIHRFIFHAGFSTREEVTETSGRGVGMDVVLDAVHQLGGKIEVETAVGAGTTFTLHLPLSAAIQTALLVELGDQILGLAERFILAVAEAGSADLVDVGGRPAFRHNGALVPIYPLAGLLWRTGQAAPAHSRRQIVLVSNGQHAIGIEVDNIRRRQDLLLKDLHPLLASCRLLSGAAVLGDGRIVLLLDPDALIQAARNGAWLGAAPCETVSS